MDDDDDDVPFNTVKRLAALHDGHVSCVQTSARVADCEGFRGHVCRGIQRSLYKDRQ